ncbi:hypothetical protein V1517DRAFT_331294 [Lipomyces orientalis]|uniref:Uncharacterized protein n=1 Tax=Lipomyces orientalis TaxID=1233043 RepID=A0ACC3TFS0_9ASCO
MMLASFNVYNTLLLLVGHAAQVAIVVLFRLGYRAVSRGSSLGRVVSLGSMSATSLFDIIADRINMHFLWTNNNKSLLHERESEQAKRLGESTYHSENQGACDDNRGGFAMLAMVVAAAWIAPQIASYTVSLMMSKTVHGTTIYAQPQYVNILSMSGDPTVAYNYALHLQNVSEVVQPSAVFRLAPSWTATGDTTIRLLATYDEVANIDIKYGPLAIRIDDWAYQADEFGPMAVNYLNQLSVSVVQGSGNGSITASNVGSVTTSLPDNTALCINALGSRTSITESIISPWSGISYTINVDMKTTSPYPVYATMTNATDLIRDYDMWWFDSMGTHFCQDCCDNMQYGTTVMNVYPNYVKVEAENSTNSWYIFGNYTDQGTPNWNATFGVQGSEWFPSYSLSAVKFSFDNGNNSVSLVRRTILTGSTSNSPSDPGNTYIIPIDQEINVQWEVYNSGVTFGQTEETEAIQNIYVPHNYAAYQDGELLSNLVTAYPMQLLGASLVHQELFYDITPLVIALAIFTAAAVIWLVVKVLMAMNGYYTNDYTIWQVVREVFYLDCLAINAMRPTEVKCGYVLRESDNNHYGIAYDGDVLTKYDKKLCTGVWKSTVAYLKNSHKTETNRES